MGKVAKEEARTRALAGREGGGGAGAVRWRGREEPIAVSVEVLNPLGVPLTLTEASFLFFLCVCVWLGGWMGIIGLC